MNPGVWVAGLNLPSRVTETGRSPPLGEHHERGSECRSPRRAGCSPR